MPKVTGPLFSADAKGTLANILTYQGGFGGHRVTRVPRHRDVQSSGQVTQRVVFLAARDEWSWLSAEEKADYTEIGHKLQMTGYNYFLKEFLKGRIKGDTRLLLPMHEGSGVKCYDRSGYGNNGTITGASWVQLLSGLWVLSFDGIDDLVNAGHDVSLALTNTGTLSVWVYLKSLVGWGGILMKGAPNLSTRFYSLINRASEGFQAYIASATAWKAVTTTFVPSLYTWYYLVFTWDGTLMKIYSQGVLNNSTSQICDAATGDYDCRIGRGRWAETPINGLIDNVCIYNRALGAGEIQRHYLESKKFFGL